MKNNGNEKNLFSKSLKSQQFFESISHHSLMIQLLNVKNTKSNQNNPKNSQAQQAQIVVQNNLNKLLSIDMTSYITLKQLIIQNKKLKNQSQSAYFLSKQSLKLIEFINGWNELYRADEIQGLELRKCQEMIKMEGRQEKERIIKGDEREKGKKKMDKGASKDSMEVYRQQQEEIVKKRLNEQKQNRLKGELKVKQISQNMNKGNIEKGQSTIVNFKKVEKNQQQRTKNIQEEQQEQIEIEIQRVQQVHQKVNDKVQAQKRQPLVKQKLVDNQEKKNKQNLINQQSRQLFSSEIQLNKQIKSSKAFPQVSQILRPEYQKTQASGIQSCSQSMQNSSMNQSVENQQNNEADNREMNIKNKKEKRIVINGSNSDSNQVNKKKVIIPLLKKVKNDKIPANYNEFIQEEKAFKSLNKNFKKQGENQIKQKIFKISLGQESQMYSNFSDTSNITNPRSLSPKVQGKKKIIKLTHTMTHTSNQGNLSQALLKDKQQASLEIRKEKSFSNISQSKSQALQMTKSTKNIPSQASDVIKNHFEKDEQLQELQRELSSSSVEPVKYSLRNQKQEINNTDKQPSEQPLQPPISRQNKTLKFIKGSSSAKNTNIGSNPSQQQFVSKKQDYENQTISEQEKSSNYPIHYPLSNAKTQKQDHRRFVNKTNNSIVVQEEPWQCDELELQEQIKKIDQKIQDRKSILALNETNSARNLKDLYQLSDQSNFVKKQQSHTRKISHHQELREIITDNKSQRESCPSQYYRQQRHTIHLKNNGLETYPINLFQQNNRHQNIYLRHQLHQNQFDKEDIQNEFHQKYQTYNNCNEPKVVRLSLNELAKTANKNSKNSVSKNDYKNNASRLSSKSREKINGLSTNKSREKLNGMHFKDDKVYYHGNREQQFFEKEIQNEQQHYKNMLNKQPSCKSILLIEQAQRRGISPSKSIRSLTGGKRNTVSPIKSYIQGKSNNKKQQNLTPKSKTMKNPQQMNNTYSPINANTPRNYQNVYQNNKNKNYQQNYERQFSEQQNLSPTPEPITLNSRSLTDMIDSQYSRAKKDYQQRNKTNSHFNKYQEFNKERKYQNEPERRQQQGYNRMIINNENNSFYSNCMKQQPYNQVNNMSPIMEPIKKWKIPVENQKNEGVNFTFNNKNQKTMQNVQNNQPKRKKIVLLSDQIEN